MQWLYVTTGIARVLCGLKLKCMIGESELNSYKFPKVFIGFVNKSKIFTAVVLGAFVEIFFKFSSIAEDTIFTVKRCRCHENDHRLN